MRRRVRIHLVIHLKGGGPSKHGKAHLRSSRKARGMGSVAAGLPADMQVRRESKVLTAESRRTEPEMGTEEAPLRNLQKAKRRVGKGACSGG